MEMIWDFLKTLLKCIGIVAFIFMCITGVCFGVFLLATSVIGGLVVCIISIALPIAVLAFVLDNF